MCINFSKATFNQLFISMKKIDDCNEALEIVLPVGLTAISTSGDLWIQDTCKEYIKCDN